MSDEPEYGPMEAAVRRSIDALPDTEKVPKHAALALLAISYGIALDNGARLSTHGPHLQAALVALGCAPTRVAAGQKPAPAGGGESSGDGRTTLRLIQSQWSKTS